MITRPLVFYGNDRLGTQICNVRPQSIQIESILPNSSSFWHHAAFHSGNCTTPFFFTKTADINPMENNPIGEMPEMSSNIRISCCTMRLDGLKSIVGEVWPAICMVIVKNSSGTGC